ncbi:Predicted PurR-regulated permease PerM [Loktanella fryxellensis]|uniref:Predicted PurR-regulated permease PerM n=1 Tax=Loktanella fryxellensis TaxID=245187 RepID=A0A1H7YVU3_9RHOB|nr:AI-2E family transporter [Loktanella fryxellensis]SEM49974.1 Predicted PurR-regulated permease PerM [Loktanella fryxellensis]
MKRATHLEAIRRSLNLLTLIAVFATCFVAKDLLLPVMLGFLMALTLSPLSRGMARIGIPHWVSAVGLIGVTAMIIGLAIYFSAGTVSTWMASAGDIGGEVQSKLSEVFSRFESVRQAGAEVASIAPGDPAVQQVVVQQPTLIDSAMGVVSSAGATLAVALVLASFLLASGNMFYVKLVQSFQTMTGKKRALSIVYDIERRVSRYLLTITLINASLGVCVGIAMYVVGLPYPYIWGMAAFLLNFLPYIGALTGVALVAALSIVTFDNLYYALVAPAAYMTLTSIEGNFVTPTLLGRRLELNTVAVFLTVVLWGWLWGIAGALVAVPFLVVFKVVADNIDSMQIIGNFLGSADEAPAEKDDEEEEAAEPPVVTAPAVGFPTTAAE